MSPTGIRVVAIYLGMPGLWRPSIVAPVGARKGTEFVTASGAWTRVRAVMVWRAKIRVVSMTMRLALAHSVSILKTKASAEYITNLAPKHAKPVRRAQRRRPRRYRHRHLSIESKRPGLALANRWSRRSKRLWRAKPLLCTSKRNGVLLVEPTTLAAAVFIIAIET